MQRNRLWLAVALLLAAGVIVFTIALRPPISTNQTAGNVSSQFHGAVFDPMIPAPNIELTSHRGDAYRLDEQKGNVVVLFFGFTSCPDVCPTTLANFRQVKQHLSEDEVDRVQFVMVTVDPERDDAERMARYVQAFDPDFIGLTGTIEEVQVAWAAYDVQPEKIEIPGSALGYSVSHPSSAFVIDPEGNLRLLHFYGLPPDAVAEDLSNLLS